MAALRGARPHPAGSGRVLHQGRRHRGLGAACRARRRHRHRRSRKRAQALPLPLLELGAGRRDPCFRLQPRLVHSTNAGRHDRLAGLDAGEDRRHSGLAFRDGTQHDGRLARLSPAQRGILEPSDDLDRAVDLQLPALYLARHRRPLSQDAAGPLLSQPADGETRTALRRDRFSRPVRHGGSVRRAGRGASHGHRLGDLADLVSQRRAAVQS